MAAIGYGGDTSMRNGLTKPENGRMQMEETGGERSRTALLTNLQARHFRLCAQNGVPVAELTALFGLARGSGYRIAKGLSYRDA